MESILSLLECLEPDIGGTRVGQLSRITQAMLAMTGRVTMLGISRWTGFGGSNPDHTTIFLHCSALGNPTVGVFPKIFMVS